MSADDASGAGKECALAIVPVQVKAAKGKLSHILHREANEPTECDRTQKTDILLRTMGQENNVSCYKITGLEVGNLDGTEFIDLPEVYTQVKIPVSKENLLQNSGNGLTSVESTRKRLMLTLKC